jgi:hypothetical protein
MHAKTWRLGLGLTAILAVSSGCKDEKKPGIESPAPSAEIKKPALDPALAQVVASASAQAAPTKPTAEGPPESGVFGEGAADRELARGAPPRFTMGADGAEPRVSLSSMLPKGVTALRLRFSSSSGGRGTLPLDFRLAVEPIGATPKPSEAGKGGDYAARVVAVDVDTAQVAVADPKLKTELGKLRGSRIRFKLAPSGAGSDFSIERAKTANVEFEDTLRSLSELLATLLFPYPEKSVGAGAYWMATTRENVLGMDTVAYRMVTVEKVEGDSLSLKLDSKRYAASQVAPELPGLPPSAGAARIEQFKSVGQGTITVTRGSVLPTEGKLNQELIVFLSLSNQPGQPAILQAQIGALLSRP